MGLELIDDDLVLVGANDTTINGSGNSLVLFERTAETGGDIRVHLEDGNDSLIELYKKYDQPEEQKMWEAKAEF